ncbi:MAG: hypothetical protein NTZ40_02150 [Cyanobacteria bacterium]|nr:hypothetical protein [Cyanobacteriota bacterium]
MLRSMVPLLRPVWSPLRSYLALVDRDGQRCSGPVLLSGVVVGTGVVRLLGESLAQTSRFSLEVLMLMVLQVFGPMLVAMIAIIRLTPDWVERAATVSGKAWHAVVLPALPVAFGLMLQFLAVSLISGVAASPRADFAGELAEVLGGLEWPDLVRALLRCALFLLAGASWCLRETLVGLARRRPLADIVGDGLLHTLLLVLLLKLFWILAIDPLRLGRPQ